MNQRTEVKIGENLIMAVPQCTPKKCVCKKNLNKIIKNAEVGFRMEAAFTYVREKTCPTVVELDTDMMARSIRVGGPESVPRILGRVFGRLAMLATAIATAGLVCQELLKWLA